MRWRPVMRKGAQISVIAMLVAIPLLAMARVDFIKGTLCSFGTESWSISCPLGVAQTSLASRTLDAGLLLSGFAFIALAFVGGRVFCSWICPQGFLSELGDRVHRALRRVFDMAGPRPDTREGYRRGQVFLYSFLAAGLVASFVFGVPVFCYICPIGLLCRAIVGSTYLGTIGGELVVVGVILLVEVSFARRGWCKYICPVGALYGACTTKRSVTVVRDAERCVGCHSCERECSMGNSPVEDRVGRTCTNCGDCVDACPEGALAQPLVQLGKKPSTLP